VEGQKKEEEKLIEIEEVEEWEIKQKKNKRSRQVFSVMEGVYSGIRYMGKEGRLRKYKGSIRRIQREDEHRSKETRKIKYGRRERL